MRFLQRVVAITLAAWMLHATDANSQVPPPTIRYTMSGTPLPTLDVPSGGASAQSQTSKGTNQPAEGDRSSEHQKQQAAPAPQPTRDAKGDKAADAKAAAPADDDLRKRVDLLQKQVQVQQEMIRVLEAGMKRQPQAGAAVENLQTEVSTLEARSKQAAQRDRDVSQAIDNVTEHMDAQERNGPRLPATLKELFLPMRTNETPLSIYGSFLENFSQVNGKSPSFSTPDFSPYFLLQLNDRFFLEANIDISNAGVAVAEAQADFIATDWLTVRVGRFITPIGFFNERLNHEWINRLPDIPLMFRQVALTSDTDGVQLRGAAYLWDTPVKIEYSLYGGNGLQLGAAPASYNDTANLQGIEGGPDEVAVKALGARVGFWVPECGLHGGVSTYFNGRYTPAASDQFNLWQLDLGYRHGNWDAQFEYADVYQQATSYIGNNIRRHGFYAQVAYRALDADNFFLQKCEVALRYSKVWFKGIDPTQVDLTAGVDAPVDRDQWTVGFNYYFYPSMALRLAYEFNHELNDINLHDNVFLAQYVWAF